MRVLVTGAGGFVGRYVLEELAEHGHTPLAMDLQFAAPLPTSIESATADLRQKDALSSVIKKMAPDACIHLGAIAFVPAGVADPDIMLSVNIGGTLNLLEVIRDQSPACRTLVVSTAQIYATASDDTPIPEAGMLAPVNLYAITKAAADLSALGFATRFDLPIMTVRPNNHTGPGQSDNFVVPSFVRQIKAIATGHANPLLSVGNLDSERIFSDVRDIVRAYRLLIEKGTPGEAYNLSGNDRMPISRILDLLCEMKGVTVERRCDPAKFRPTDRSPILDITKLQQHTDWQPQINIEQTLQDMLAAI